MTLARYALPMFLALLLALFSGPSRAVELAPLVEDLANDLPIIKYAARIAGQCHSLSRFRQRSRELRNWVEDPEFYIQNSTKPNVGILWIAGRSDWNCACYRSMVEAAGVNWKSFLVINGMSPRSKNWKMTCRK